jgi:hypothetical protein
MTICVAELRDRTLLFLTTPALWPEWPFLPLVRRSKGQEELGVILDSRSLELMGLSSTVYFTNLFVMPTTLNEFLALPHETFDSAEELVAAGWYVD